MAAKSLFLFSLVVITINLRTVRSHGRLMNPVHRGSAWRLGFHTPENWNDMGNYCGGIGMQHVKNGGKCGLCGDNYADRVPRQNENGGKYGTGTIVKTYNAGQEIEVDVELTSSHLGYFEFSLCPLESSKQLETEECFDSHKLRFADGKYRYTNVTKSGHYAVRVQLPAEVVCEHCVLRWEYTTGHIWGKCGNGTSRRGCGAQEHFRTCSDVKIVPVAEDRTLVAQTLE